MQKKEQPRYSIEGIDFDAVYNRNEYVVRAELKKILDEEVYDLSAKDVQDVYALTLNDVIPHYAHVGTIVLFPNVRREEIVSQIKRNIQFVMGRPKD